MCLSKPLAIDLFFGRGGWGRAFAAEGYRVIGFDIEHLPHHGPVPEGCELVLQDVRTLHGRQFKDAAVIVASSPCQRYSYMAMPWSRAKREIRWQEWQRTSPFSPGFDLNELFEQAFRLQREASEAAGHHIPLIAENVKGAQRWVGSAKWHAGPYFLWGDVPAIMPYGQWRKGVGSGRSWFYQNGGNARSANSKSAERREWSARAAEVPLDLAQWIAQCFKPTSSPVLLRESATSASQHAGSTGDGPSTSIMPTIERTKAPSIPPF